MPKAIQRMLSVGIECGFSHSKELPAASFQLALALHIGFVAVGVVPTVAVAFDSQPRLPAFDNEINPLARNFVLCKHGEILAKKFQSDIDLEPAIEWRRGSHNLPIVLGRPPLEFFPLDPGNLSRRCVPEEINQLSSKTGVAKIVTCDGME